MVHTLAWATRVPEGEINKQFREVFSRYRSVEYQWSIQQLPLCDNLSSDEIRRLVYIGRRAFDLTRKKHLKPYPGVEETLEWAFRSGIVVIAVSNAPLYLAWRRIQRLGLQAWFSGIAASEGFAPPENDMYAQDYKSKRPLMVNKVELAITREHLKPSPRMYLDVLERLHIDPRDTWVVGDSLSKDVRPAMEIGANGVWASYGTVYREENLATLLDITHWSSAQIEDTYAGVAVTPTATIGAFQELMDLIPKPQMTLGL
jgi:FMN phosphatase YigB (HAD superfamily)